MNPAERTARALPCRCTSISLDQLGHSAECPYRLRAEVAREIEKAITEAMVAGAESFLVTWYGERCPEPDPDCPTCEAWAAYDEWIKR